LKKAWFPWANTLDFLVQLISFLSFFLFFLKKEKRRVSHQGPEKNFIPAKHVGEFLSWKVMKKNNKS